MHSIHTARVKFGSRKAAREYFANLGYITEDGIHYYPPEGTVEPEILEAEVQPDIPSAEPSGRKPILVTSYLLGSYVNVDAFKALKAHAEFLNAEILVIAHKYTNPTSLQGCLREEEGYDFIDSLVKPYLCWTNHTIYGHEILGSVQVNCNNLNPLPRIKKFTTRHSILGHPMQSLHIKPVVQGMPVVLWSTGTISNIDPAANLTAQQAQFHYKFGWIVLEPDGDSRNIHATKAGQFTDAEFIYNPLEFEGIEDGLSTLSTIWGDLHVEQVDPKALRWAIGLTKSFKSPSIVLHDFFDATAVNPHSEKIERGDHSLYDDYDAAHDVLNTIERDTKCSALFLVESNHNDMLSRYFKSTPIHDMGMSDIPILKQWLGKNMKPEDLFTNASRLRIDETYQTLYGTHLGLHGDKGINGAKGSLNSFFQANIRAVIGHSHTPGMLGGVSQVGCLCRLKLGYNDKGASSWCHSLVRLDIFGKHQHFIRFMD
jgi:hypothetical protein